MKNKNKLHTKDFVYLVDFLLNIGVVVLAFFQSYRVSGSMLGGILTDRGIIIISILVMDIVAILCQFFYMIGRLRGKNPNDMDIVNRWPDVWIVGKILILIAFAAGYFLNINMALFLISA